ncbi:hypothetical protein [Demequina aestuarii]|uniref:hypothetical protein n=1 Tax=Demequina aestuarii TaxID=327095 RepID=UPI00078467EB|nr:hypothetical protein [Demequina aestuarii]
MTEAPPAPIDDDSPRQYFENVEQALKEFRIPVENHRLARETLATFEHGRIYMPVKSRQYVAFEGREGPPALAWLHSGYVELRTAPGTYSHVPLPTNSIGGGSGGGTRRNRADEQREPCPTCYTELPATGMCGTCD